MRCAQNLWCLLLYRVSLNPSGVAQNSIYKGNAENEWRSTTDTGLCIPYSERVIDHNLYDLHGRCYFRTEFLDSNEFLVFIVSGIYVARAIPIDLTFMVMVSLLHLLFSLFRSHPKFCSHRLCRSSVSSLITVVGVIVICMLLL